jgi:hypothetical protein
MLNLVLSITLIFQTFPGAVANTQQKEAQDTPQGKSTKPDREPEIKTKKKSSGSTDKREEFDEATLELRQRSANLILLAAENANKLDDKRSVVRVQALAADALWKGDQARARQLFQNAFAGAIDYYSDGKGQEQEQLASGLSLSKPDLRLEVIRLVGKHDAQFSRLFTDRYVEEKRREEEEKRNKSNQLRKYDPAFGAVDEASHDTLQIAEKLLDVNKKDAVDLAEQAFAKGVPQAAGYLFAEIAKRDRATADQLYLMALDRLRRDRSPVPGQLLLLASYPFGDGNVWVGSGDGVNSYHFQVSEKFTIDENLIQRFIATAFTVIARNAGPDISQLPDASVRVGSALFAAKLLQPRIAKYSPERLGEWQSLTNVLYHAANQQTQLGVDKTLNQIDRNIKPETAASIDDRIKELLDRAQSTNNFAQRDELYQEAALLAGQKPDTPGALEIADKISNREHSKKLCSWLNFEASTRAINERKLDEARRYATEVDATDQSAYLFFQIARIALGDKDQVRARILLEEAAQKAVAAENTPEKLRALLGLASLFTRFDSQRGFDLAGEAVRTANKIRNYGPDQARLVRTLETPGGKGSSVSVENAEEFDIGKTLSSLAKTDFERALLLAQSLEDKPLGLMAVISVASSVFEKKSTDKATQ